MVPNHAKHYIYCCGIPKTLTVFYTEYKLTFDFSYVSLLLQTTLFCVRIVLFEQAVLVGDIRLRATNVYLMIYSYQAKDKRVF